MSAARRIGFMQGRLSPQIDGMIQAFPWERWEGEFRDAEALGFHLMEWTLDQARIDENPLMTAVGRQHILALSERHRLAVASITGDCFMQAPFWKAYGKARDELLATAAAVIRNGADVGAHIVVVPLVDNGGIDTVEDENALREGTLALTHVLAATGSRIAFESDFEPHRLARFIDTFPMDLFGINYDIGNSASLGWDPVVEIGLLADRIINVHVKDRLLGGTTVPLGEGAAAFDTVFRKLKDVGYAGRYILQTARATDGDHLGVADRYRRMTISWIDTP